MVGSVFKGFSDIFQLKNSLGRRSDHINWFKNHRTDVQTADGRMDAKMNLMSTCLSCNCTYARKKRCWVLFSIFFKSRKAKKFLEF